MGETVEEVYGLWRVRKYWRTAGDLAVFLLETPSILLGNADL